MKISRLLPIVSMVVAAMATPAVANTGKLLEDLRDFSPDAGYSQGSDGHVIIDCWRQPWGDGGEAIIAAWRLRSRNRRPLLYVNGDVNISESTTPLPLNGSPAGFSTLYDVASGSEELYLEQPISADRVVTATINGFVEVGLTLSP